MCNVVVPIESYLTVPGYGNQNFGGHALPRRCDKCRIQSFDRSGRRVRGALEELRQCYTDGM